MLYRVIEFVREYKSGEWGFDLDTKELVERNKNKGSEKINNFDL